MRLTTEPNGNNEKKQRFFFAYLWHIASFMLTNMNFTSDIWMSHEILLLLILYLMCAYIDKSEANVMIGVRLE